MSNSRLFCIGFVAMWIVFALLGEARPGFDRALGQLAVSIYIGALLVAFYGDRKRPS